MALSFDNPQYEMIGDCEIQINVRYSEKEYTLYGTPAAEKTGEARVFVATALAWVKLLKVQRKSKANDAEALRLAEAKIPELLENLKPFALKNPTVIKAV